MPKQLYDFVNSDEFTREHLSVFVAALLDKEWTDYMEEDLNTFGYNMTVDEFRGWKIDQGLISYDIHESILDEELDDPGLDNHFIDADVERLNKIFVRKCNTCGGDPPLCFECFKEKERYG